MSSTTTKAKVYYLPAPEPVQAPPSMSFWTRLRRRAIHGWWHARLSLADMRTRFRRPRRRRADDYAAWLRTVVEDSPALLIERRRPARSRPATILDFEAARLRLRPQTP
jgi:hypothetical protein